MNHFLALRPAFRAGEAAALAAPLAAGLMPAFDAVHVGKPQERWIYGATSSSKWA